MMMIHFMENGAESHTHRVDDDQELARMIRNWIAGGPGREVKVRWYI